MLLKSKDIVQDLLQKYSGSLRLTTLIGGVLGSSVRIIVVLLVVVVVLFPFAVGSSPESTGLSEGTGGSDLLKLELVIGT